MRCGVSTKPAAGSVTCFNVWLVSEGTYRRLARGHILMLTTHSGSSNDDTARTSPSGRVSELTG